MQKHTYTPPRYNYSQIPAGNHRARISAATWDTTKSTGRDKILFTFKISAFGNLTYNFIWCDNNPQELDRTNYYFEKLCKAFNLNPEDLNNPDFSFHNWIGAEGGVIISYENDNPYPRVKKFLTRKQLAFLPPFEDGPKQQYIQAPSQQPQQQAPQQQNFYSQQQQQQTPQQQNFYTQQQAPQQQGGFFSPNADPSQQIPF